MVLSIAAEDVHGCVRTIAHSEENRIGRDAKLDGIFSHGRLNFEDGHRKHFVVTIEGKFSRNWRCWTCPKLFSVEGECLIFKVGKA
jgi:hypothetical protein